MSLRGHQKPHVLTVSFLRLFFVELCCVKTHYFLQQANTMTPFPAEQSRGETKGHLLALSGEQSPRCGRSEVVFFLGKRRTGSLAAYVANIRMAIRNHRVAEDQQTGFSYTQESHMSLV